MSNLLSRDEFRKRVFERDNCKCVVCTEKAVDAHHIIERKLWPDEGYYLDNGASLCEVHHKLAETNHLCPSVIRTYARIGKVVLPPSFNKDWDYDKWGKRLIKWNQTNSGGVITHTKYPSTSYLDFSPGGTGDKDREIADIQSFLNVPLVFTIKMDGSNVKINNDYISARNGIVADHKSFDMLKAMHKNLMKNVPTGVDIFGEWLYVKHSISYVDNLKLNSYLQLFAVFNRNTNLWSSWKDVEYVAKFLGFPTPLVLHKEVKFDDQWKLTKFIVGEGDKVIKQGHEGIVIRSAYPFHWSQLGRFVAKYVRKDHVQTDEHWSSQPIVRNEVVK